MLFPEMHVGLDKILLPWLGSNYKAKWSLDMCSFLGGKKRENYFVCVCLLCDRHCLIAHKY